MMGRIPLGVWAAVLITLAGCAPPIGISRVSGRAVHRSLTASALSTGRVSEWTRNTVNAWGLLARFDDRPEDALRTLRDIVVSGRGGRPELFALGELSFLHGNETGKRPYLLAAAVYTYAFLFPEKRGDCDADELDPRTRLAADMYNRAITMAFESKEGFVEFAAETYELPFGVMDVEVDRDSFRWGDRRLVEFLPVAEFKVHGLRNRYRTPGLGAPLAARAVPVTEATVAGRFVARRARVAVTALLRLPGVHAGIASGHLHGKLELYAASETETADVEGRRVPLESEETAAIAAQLATSPIWKRELWGFLGRGETGESLPVLGSLEPYRLARIPVVFVHGTASSPGRWADMANDLLADPWIRHRYQFWYYMYDTGNPIAYSALQLRDKLTEAVHALDPDGSSPCLHQMVIVGHSQGGLLTKLTAVDTGSRLWDRVSRVPLADVPASPEVRALLERALFVKPLPFVRRLVFIATPHRGSFRVTTLVNGLLRRFVKLPDHLIKMSREAAFHGPGVFYAARTEAHLPTAAENMTPGNPFLEGLASIPVVEGVPYHSIIAIKGNGPPETGNDGVVSYTSAHLDGAASELVVRSSHSTQSEPATIQEVRRILRLHADSLANSGIRCGD